MKALTKVLDKVLATACVVLFALLVVVVVWQVFTRQVLHNPAAWTEEVSRYVFVWLGLFATALVFSERGHIAVDFVARKLPLGAQKANRVLIQILITSFALIVLVYGGWRAGQGAWNQSLQALPFTLGQMYIVMPITGILIAIYAVNNIIDVLSGAVPPFAEELDEDAAQYLDGRQTVQTDESLNAPRDSAPPGMPPPGNSTDRPETRS
ncbi:MAG: TRAP transporter small permease [Dermatophilaceae bacterium]